MLKTIDNISEYDNVACIATSLLIFYIKSNNSILACEIAKTRKDLYEIDNKI